jgi:hypothetical protein
MVIYLFCPVTIQEEKPWHAVNIQDVHPPPTGQSHDFAARAPDSIPEGTYLVPQQKKNPTGSTIVA